MKNFNILKWALVVAIVVVLNLLFNVSTSLIFEQPQYDQFCKAEPLQIQPETAKLCVEQGGQWNGPAVPVQSPSVESTPKPVGYCDLQFTCRQKFEDAQTIYNRNSFVVLVVLGALAIIIGFFVSASAVSLGLTLGGVLSLIIASMRYWSYMQEYWRFGVLAVALIALCWLGVKKIKE